MMYVFLFGTVSIYVVLFTQHIHNIHRGCKGDRVSWSENCIFHMIRLILINWCSSCVQNRYHLQWSGKCLFFRRSCTYRYKHETFRLCSSNLCKYFLISHQNFSIFKMANGNFKMAAKFIC